MRTLSNSEGFHFTSSLCLKILLLPHCLISVRSSIDCRTSILLQMKFCWHVCMILDCANLSKVKSQNSWSACNIVGSFLRSNSYEVWGKSYPNEEWATPKIGSNQILKNCVYQIIWILLFSNRLITIRSIHMLTHSNSVLFYELIQCNKHRWGVEARPNKLTNIIMDSRELAKTCSCLLSLICCY